MKVYVIHVVIDEHSTFISIKTDIQEAYKLIGDRIGIITEMEIDKVYPEGIGVCKHCHFNDEEPEDG